MFATDVERGPQVHRELREPAGARAPAAHAGRRRRERQRRARLRDARVDRSGAARPRATSRCTRSSTALRNNNLQVAGGAIGSPPFNDNPAAYQLNIRAQGRLDTPEEFADAIIKRDAQGRVTRIGDVARVELGAQNYAVNAYKSLEPAVSLSVQQAPNTNALETWDNIRSTMEELKSAVPARRRLRDHLQPRGVHARGRGRGAGDAARGDDAGRHRRHAVPAALAHGGDPAARDSGVADRHAGDHVGVRLLAEQPVDVRRWCCRSASWWTTRSSWSRTPSGTSAPAWRRARPRTSRWTKCGGALIGIALVLWPCSCRRRSWAASPGSSTSSSR